MMVSDFQDWALKITEASALLSLRSLILGEASSHAMKTLKQYRGEFHTSEELGPLVNSLCQPVSQPS